MLPREGWETHADIAMLGPNCDVKGRNENFRNALVLLSVVVLENTFLRLLSTHRVLVDVLHD